MSTWPGESAPKPAHPFEGLTPPPERFYKPARSLALAAIASAGLLTCIELVEIPVAFRAGRAYTAAAEGIFVSNAPVRYFWLAIVWTAALVLSWAVTSVWLTRARHNAEALSPAPHRRAGGWIWFGWVVPVVSLWFPFQVVEDVRNATDRRRDHPLVGWWWGAFLLYLFSGQVVQQLVPASGRSDDQSLATRLALVEGANALCAVLALTLWTRLVLAINRSQERESALPPAERLPPPSHPPDFIGKPPVW